MTAQSLDIFYNDSEGNRLPFPDSTEPAVLKKWKYTAGRQDGGVPAVDATLLYKRCLEDEWNTLRPYIVLPDGDILYADRINPDSSKDNTDARFSHTLRFVSARSILSQILFFDAVTPDSSQLEKDKYRSNFTEFTFSGTLEEFVARLTSSLAFSGVSGFSFVFDSEELKRKTAEVSFSDAYMSDAVSHILSDFSANFYWIGNVCHIGDCQNDIPQSLALQYGRAKGLLSAKKSNTSEKIINAITGFGGTENVPYYYPNDNEYGETEFTVYNANKADFNVDWAKLYSKIGTKTGIELALAKKLASSHTINIREFYSAQWTASIFNYDATDGSNIISSGYATQATVVFTRSVNIRGGAGITLNLRDIPYMKTSVSCRTAGGEKVDISNVNSVINIYLVQGGNRKVLSKSSGMTVNLDYSGLSVIEVEITSDIWYTYDTTDKSPATFILNLPADPYAVLASPQDNLLYWYTGGKFLRYSEAGITLGGTYSNVAEFTSEPAHNGLQGEDRIFFFNVESHGTLASAVRMKIVSRAYVTPTGKLVPSIYRESFGLERFYYAKNHSASDDCADKASAQHSAFLIDGSFPSFGNVFSEDRQMQAVETFDDIHPTIEGITNSAGQLFGAIIDVAFDDDDNDNTDSDGRYLHPYFYIRLARFSGDFAFSLLDHAIQGEEAKLCMTSCNGCPACQFTVQVIYDSAGKAYNPVILDASGNLIEGDYTKKLASSVSSCTAANQDTTAASVWIAVSKEDSTLGTIMPSAAAGLKPVAGDTFVLTGISFPPAYLRAAEKRLDRKLIEHMLAHNSGTFDYSVTLSRIFLQDNPDIASLINENTRLWLSYNGKLIQLYVSSYSVNIDDDILADISIELSSEFKAYESKIDKAIGQAVSDSRDSIISTQRSKERTTPAIETRASSSSYGASTWAELANKPTWLTDTPPAVSVFSNDAGYITSESLTPYALKTDLGSLAYKSLVTYNELAAAAVMTSKIADGAVTNAKIATPYMTLWGQKVTLGGKHDGSIYLGANMGIRFTDGTKTAWISYDSANNALYVQDNDGNPVNFYATGGISAYGHSGIEQGGGGTVDVEQILTSGTPIATVAGVTLYAPVADTSGCVTSLSAVNTYDIGYYNNGTLLGQLTAPYAKITEGIGKPYGDFPGLRSFYWAKNDNSGSPSYLLISKVCAASEWSNWGTGHPMYGISGTVHGRRVGNMNGTGTWHVNAAVSYSTDYIKTETSDATYMQPCVVTYGGNVYVALRLLGSGYDMMILGSGYNLLDTPIQVNCTDLSGTCPSVTVLRDYTGVNLTATSLSAASLTARYDITTTDGNLSVARNATINGETRLNGSVHLPDACTFFGSSGIYVNANRPGEKYGDAAFIGVHQGYAGTGTVATVNLDGTVRLWHCLAINQDPDTDASLRVGGLSKLDYLTLGGIKRPDGYWFAAPSGYFGNPSSDTYTSFGDGWIELSHPTTPYIDFHYNKSTADYTSRLIAAEDGVLMIDSATADPALRIGKAYLRYDAINNALYVTGRDGAQVNLYATGGLAAYSAIGSVTQLANLQLTGQLTAASVKANAINMGLNKIYDDGEQLYISMDGGLAIGGYSTSFDSDGWLYMTSSNEIQLTNDAAIRIGSTANTHRVTDLYADGSYVYITVNGKRYRLTPSATTTV